MKKILFFTMLFFSYQTLAKITAQFVPNPVSQGSSVELILSSDQPFKGVPNINVLQNDFVIGGQQQRQSSQWINGKGSTEYQLAYTLFPNKSGTITVTGLKIGSQEVPNISLNVSPDKQYEQKGNIALSVECPNTSLYPEQTLLCKVYLDDSVGIVDGEILAPTTSAGSWQQILPPVPMKSNAKNAQRYQSFFTFIPKQSGTLEIPSFVFQGKTRLITKNNTRYNNIFDFMMAGIPSTATKPVSAQSKPFSLTVKEKPAAYEGWWLPSTQVTLSETYDMPQTINIGDPISRTLKLSAQNVLADNMPVPAAPQTSGLKVYANPEQRSDSESGGQVTVTLTFVPTQSGKLTLPEIQVPWFNVATETIETASVPEHTFFVAESLSQPKPTTTDPLPSTEKQPLPVPPQTFPWIWIIVAVAGAFLLGLLIAFIIFKKTNKISEAKQKKKPLPDLYPF